jgi:ribosomal protein S18 acetylase RimI-like enzyme
MTEIVLRKNRKIVMGIEIRTEKDNVDYQAVADILRRVHLSDYDAKTEEKVFRNSYAVAFAYDGEKVVGCGRALSDGVCQAAIYNIALDEEYRGRQIGRAIIESLLEQVKGCTVILYTHPQTLAMYEKFGFRRQKTGFVLFEKSEEESQWMDEVGFLLPEGYRFNDNEYERQPYRKKE